MALFKTRLTEELQKMEQRVRDQQAELKEKLIEDTNRFNAEYPVGTLIRYIPNNSTWDKNFGVVVKPARYVFDDTRINNIDSISIDVFIARFDYRGYLRPHDWNDTFNLYSYKIEKCSLKDVYNFKKQYLTDNIKKTKDDLKHIEKLIRNYKKDRNILTSVMSESIEKFKNECNIEIKENYGNEFLCKENTD